MLQAGPRFVIVAIGRVDGDSEMTPFGHLHDGNPYAAPFGWARAYS